MPRQDAFLSKFSKKGFLQRYYDLDQVTFLSCYLCKAVVSGTESFGVHHERLPTVHAVCTQDTVTLGPHHAELIMPCMPTIDLLIL
jgi:hypothetical protein